MKRYKICAIFFIICTSFLSAQTRRAFLVGIDRYQPGKTPAGRCRKEWSNLEGCVNDVKIMKAILSSSKFNFKAENVHILIDKTATRKRILRGLKTYLIDDTEPGDMCLFYYAGHGSRVKNTLSNEPDKMDETLVPADWYRGVGDIRDKELKKLFNQILDKTSHLTVIFDSCHSSSATRGIPRSLRHRSLPPDPCDVAQPPDNEKSPAQRGAIILSAAQDFQSAVEIVDENHLSRGLFTWALSKILKNTGGNISPGELLLKVKALMHSEGHYQEPNLEGKPSITAKPLLSGGGQPVFQPLRVAVSRVVKQRLLIELLGGLAIGIRENCILKKTNHRKSEQAVRVRVTALHGLGRCTAKVIQGNIKSVKSGDLFQIEKWVVAREARLKVFLPQSALSHQQLLGMAREIVKLRNSNQILWVKDPTVTSPSHIISWRPSGWMLQSNHNKKFLPSFFQKAKPPEASILLKKILKTNRNNDKKPRVFLQMPLSKEMAGVLEHEIKDNSHSIVTVNWAEGCHYLLAGRYTGKKISYAWILPNMTQENGDSDRLPVRTRWTAPVLEDTRFQQCAEKLSDGILRLMKVRAWMQLDSPFTGERFPYRLALKKSGTGESTLTGPLLEGETYGLTLKVEEKQLKHLKSIEKRYVYVFSIDSRGKGALLFPHRIFRNTGNCFPVDGNPMPKEIQLGAKSIFTITPPFGTDTFFLLSTTDPLSNPLVLDFEGVYEKKPGETLTALETLLLDLKMGVRQKNRHLIPINWAIERLPMVSKPKLQHQEQK